MSTRERGRGGAAEIVLDVGEAGGKAGGVEPTTSVVEMDVVGGVIVAAQSGKGGAVEAERRMIGVKRTHASAASCSGDYGAVVLGRSWGEPWIQSSRLVSPRKEGAAGVERDDYELRSVLSRGAREQSSSGVTGSEVGGGGVMRVGRSASASCSVASSDHHGAFATSDTTRALLTPFYRPSNPGFAKPMPVIHRIPSPFAPPFRHHSHFWPFLTFDLASVCVGALVGRSAPVPLEEGAHCHGRGRTGAHHPPQGGFSSGVLQSSLERSVWSFLFLNNQCRLQFFF